MSDASSTIGPVHCKRRVLRLSVLKDETDRSAAVAGADRRRWRERRNCAHFRRSPLPHAVVVAAAAALPCYRCARHSRSGDAPVARTRSSLTAPRQQRRWRCVVCVWLLRAGLDSRVCGPLRASDCCTGVVRMLAVTTRWLHGNDSGQRCDGAVSDRCAVPRFTWMSVHGGVFVVG